ncbi:unnamed protein product [Ectocarpus sp. CCAP 1310/34]|nr:unnamed protein product [Ectocarpus sp. CCAP 1310/34]
MYPTPMFTDPRTATPLYIAAMQGHLGAVKVLLHAKANPLLTRSSECSGRSFVPLEVAAQTGRSAVVRELLREFGIRCCGGPSGRLLDALRVAAVYGQVDIMSIIMGAGVVDPVGLALLAAVGSGKEAAVGFLLRQQQERWQTSYVNTACDDDGLTALLWSFGGNNNKPCNPRITRRLVDAGADTTSTVQLRAERSRTRVNMTPLEYVNEATRRVLLQAVAVHAVSWMWPSDDPVLARPANSPRTTKHSPTPLSTMLTVLRRRARTRASLWDTLFRWAVTRFFDRSVGRFYWIFCCALISRRSESVFLLLLCSCLCSAVGSGRHDPVEVTNKEASGDRWAPTR